MEFARGTASTVRVEVGEDWSERICGCGYDIIHTMYMTNGGGKLSNVVELSLSW